MSNEIGGISRTVNYKGYRMDIGGHRFFSKSDVVMDWWLNILPLENRSNEELTITYQNQSREIYHRNKGINPENTDRIMLSRNRQSRILFFRKFFNYPLTISPDTLSNLGFLRAGKIVLSYVVARILPIKKERNILYFFINRFGKVIYNTCSPEKCGNILYRTVPLS